MPGFDPMEDQRRRQREHDEAQFQADLARQRADLERARAEGEREHEVRAREREIERLQREHERGRERDERERERERDRAQRHEERRTRHEERHAFRFARRGFNFDVNVDPDEIARSVSAAFVGVDDDPGNGETFDETVEKTFSVEGMPRLRVRNVSGETTVRTGAAAEVKIVARKRVRGVSADRAKRLLENVEVRIEQDGNDIYVEPHLYEQERSWLDLFRGKRLRVDFEITVPRECAIDAQTVSGDLSVHGTRGPARVESVSGDVDVVDLQGPMRLRSVSGDVQCVDYVGLLEGSSVSGDVQIKGRVRGAELHTVSGDISIELDPRDGRESRLKTISGDVELGLVASSCTCDFQTASGDLECDVPARIIREGRKDRMVVIGDGGSRLHVKTVSGDLTIKRAASAVTAEDAGDATTGEAEAGAAHDHEHEAEGDVERTAPMAPPAGARIRDLLERVARGEVGVDEAAAKLDETRRNG
jgi:hypothetical protein